MRSIFSLRRSYVHTWWRWRWLCHVRSPQPSLSRAASVRTPQTSQRSVYISKTLNSSLGKEGDLLRPPRPGKPATQVQSVYKFPRLQLAPLSGFLLKLHFIVVALSATSTRLFRHLACWSLKVFVVRLFHCMHVPTCSVLKTARTKENSWAAKLPDFGSCCCNA